MTVTSDRYKKNSIFDLLLYPLRHWVNNIEIENPQMAHLICSVISCNCPFERDVTFFGKKLFHIPPLCKLNPLYEQFMGLRFKALSYLTDVCGEDVTKYIC
ncbi:MAG: Mo-dependent nitrogenase C-terminal domain-containing protein [Prochloraceae cyanobacterium]|nr:Mo-dependent nitrogenase C-terminal domain-containing protein [Prochloraceae cyanobacterium]